MIQNKPYPTDSIVAEINNLCGRPPVLTSENLEAYQRLLFGLFETIQPRDTLEQLFVRGLADSFWEILRLTRHKTLSIERKQRQTLEGQAHQQPATEFDHAEALELGIKYAKQLDDLLNAATARRDDILVQLDRYVEFGLGGQRDIGFQPLPAFQPGKPAALNSTSNLADSGAAPETRDIEQPPSSDGEQPDPVPKQP
jgi:hypothetical protein